RPSRLHPRGRARARRCRSRPRHRRAIRDARRSPLAALRPSLPRTSIAYPPVYRRIGALRTALLGSRSMTDPAADANSATVDEVPVRSTQGVLLVLAAILAIPVVALLVAFVPGGGGGGAGDA